MKQKRFGSRGAGLRIAGVAVLLTVALAATGCKHDGDDFIAITGLADLQTMALVNIPLTLSASVVPANATNKTIEWSGAGVSNGVLTATAAGPVPITVTIKNGQTESTAFSKTFTITAHDAGSGVTTNPFGTDATPEIWAMDDNDARAYVIMKNTTWTAYSDEEFYSSGSYTWIDGTNAAYWVVGAGESLGNKGIILKTGNTTRVENFTHEYSDMNGTFTRLDQSKIVEAGTWISNTPIYGGYYLKIEATAGADPAKGTFTQSISTTKTDPWTQQRTGTYPKTGMTNPAICTYTDNIPGSNQITVFIIGNTLLVSGTTFTKQP